LIETLFINRVWLAIILGVGAYAAEYLLAGHEAYLYHTGAKNFIVLAGRYEQTTAIQQLELKRRIASLKFVVPVVILAVAIFVVWQICIPQYNRPDLFAFLLGGLVLLEASGIMQRARNVVLFRHARDAEGLQGKIEYSKRLVFTLYYTEQYAFTVLCGLLFLLTGSWFFLGGALTTFVSSRRLRDWTVMRT
jgi:hypothetical protein